MLFNPFGDDAIVDVSFLTDTGMQEPAGLQALVVPRRSRITIPVQDSVLRQTRVAAHVHARAGRVVAEQTQIFDDVDVDGTTRNGIALSAGATSPATGVADPGRHHATTAAGCNSRWPTSPATTPTSRCRRSWSAARPLPAQNVRVPAQGVVAVDVTTRVPLDTDVAVVATARAVDGRRVPIVAELLATWAPVVVEHRRRGHARVHRHRHPLGGAASPTSTAR